MKQVNSRAREDYSPATYAAQRETRYRRRLDLACANYQDRESAALEETFIATIRISPCKKDENRIE